jgi:hypothetical protein
VFLQVLEERSLSGFFQLESLFDNFVNSAFGDDVVDEDGGRHPLAVDARVELQIVLKVVGE